MSPELEDRLAALAGHQHGLVCRRQLLGLGLSPAAIARRVKAGRLQALHRGVYLVGPLRPARATAMAAVLAGGPTAVLSHSSAASLWGLTKGVGDGSVPEPVHVTVPGSGRGGRPGIRFHRVAALTDDERAAVDGIPVTAPTRTLVDIAGALGSRELERALAVAERESLIGSDELAAIPERYKGRPGMPVLRALLQEAAGPDFIRSEAERRCLELIRTARLPRPHANVPVGPYELDLFWPDEGVAIEVDGWAHHSSRPRFEGDRRKDAWLRARGIDVIRLTWRQITRTPVATAVEIGQVLALARARRAANHPPTE